ncbi:MAG: tetratricopeptide repeat protein [Planctomycetota bacterium]
MRLHPEMTSELIKDVLFEVLECEGLEREARIRARCGSDEALEKRIRDLVAASERADGRLQVGGAAEQEQIAGRRIVRLLGEGGFGLVYLAEETEPIERRVAIKVLRPGLERGSILARFQTERRAMALMRHPGIAQVYEAGNTVDGVPYVVMEYVDGPTITEHCRALSVRDRVRLVEQVCQAVHHAHQRGVIHRDIKPSNILIADPAGDAIAKVIDFGIAKALEGESDDRTLTQAGVGTPRFMAPEQAMSNSARTDTRADVYALGAVLFACIAGAAPFEADRFVRTHLSGHLDQTPPRLRARLDENAQGVRWSGGLTDLEWIMRRAMAEEPDRRYPSANALGQDLRRWLDGRPVEAGPERVTYRLRKLVTRHPTGVLGLVCAGLALLAATIASTVYATRADGARLEAQQREAQARHELEKYESMTAFTRRMFEGIDPSVARGADTALLRVVLEDAARDLGEDPPADPEVRAELRLMIARASWSIGQLERAMQMVETALEELTTAVGPDDERVYNAMSMLGALYADGGRLVPARDVLQRVLAFRTMQYGEGVPQSVDVLSNLAGIEHRLGNHREARQRYEVVLDAYAAFYGETDPRTTRTKVNLAMAVAASGEPDVALVMLREAVEAHAEMQGVNAPDTLHARSNLAIVLEGLGERNAALSQYTEVVSAQQAILAYGHPSVVASMLNLGDLQRRMGDLDAAVGTLTEALERGRSGLPQDDPRLLRVQMSLALALRSANRAPEAVDLLAAVIEGQTRLYGPDHDRVLHAEALHAHTLASAGDIEDGQRRATSVAARARVLLADRPDRLLPVINSLSFVPYLAGDTAGELELNLEQYELQESLRGADHPTTRRTATYIAVLYERLGDANAAADWVRRGEAVVGASDSASETP